MRELHNEIQRMVVLCDGEASLGPDLLSPPIANQGRITTTPEEQQGRFTLKERVEMLECALIKELLNHFSLNPSRNSVTQSTEYSKIPFQATNKQNNS